MHFHELKQQKGETIWHDTDVTERTGSPLSSGSTLAGFAWERGKSRQIAYTSHDGCVHELSAGMGDEWSARELIQLMNAPLADGAALAGYALETRNTKQVVYVTDDAHIQELQADERGNWTANDLMQLASTPGAQLTNPPDASNSLLLALEWAAEFAKLIVYLDMHENPALHVVLLMHGEKWKHLDLTTLIGVVPLV